MSRTRACHRGRRRGGATGDLIPLAAVWDSEIVPPLKAVPGLQPAAIFEMTGRRHPERGVGVRRTMRRRVRTWRPLFDSEQEVMFRLVHEPGRMGLSDLNEMADLAITWPGRSA